MSEELVKEFKATYHQEGKDNLTVQTPYLSKLAEVYEKRAADDQLEDWTSVLKAHALYNSCSARSPGTVSALEYQLKAFGIQNSYNKTHGLPEVPSAQLLLLRTAHKLQLHAIREKYRHKVAPLNILMESYQTLPEQLCSDQNKQIETEFCVNMEAISRQCTADMVCFAQGIIEDAVQLLQAKPPCGLAVVALGSLAREEGTPYSDLEFFFLVERKDPTMISYFENLAMTIYFLIGNLQETTLKYMSIGELKEWFEDCSQNGFRIDGLQDKAGNIPTGNGTSNPKNKWICTLQEITLRYLTVFTGQAPCDDTDADISGDESDMMTFLKLIYSCRASGQQMYDQLCDTIDARPDNEFRMLQTMKTLVNDRNKFFWDPLESRFQSGLMMMNVKIDFYRSPSLGTLNLKIFHHLKCVSSWETLVGLPFEKLFRVILSVALFARLSSYLHYDSQHDLICIQSSNVSTGETPQRHWHMPWAVLVAYCVNYYQLEDSSREENYMYQHEIKYKAVVHAAIALADNHLIVTYAQHVSFECLTLPDSMTSNHVLYIAHAFLVANMYSKCIHLLQKLHQTIQLQSASNKAAIYSLLFAANAYLGLNEESVRWKRELMSSGVENLTLSENSYLILALGFLKASNIPTGFDVSIIQGNLKESVSSSALFLRTCGLLCFLNDDYNKALEYYTQWQEHLYKTYGSGVDADTLADIILQRAWCYQCLAQHATSLILYKEALVIKMRLYGTQLNYNYGHLYEIICLQYLRCKQYKQAERAGQQALKFYHKFGTEKRVVYMYELLEDIYRALGDFITSNAYQKLVENFVYRDIVNIDCNSLC